MKNVLSKGLGSDLIADLPTEIPISGIHATMHQHPDHHHQFTRAPTTMHVLASPSTPIQTQPHLTQQHQSYMILLLVKKNKIDQF